MADSDNDTGNAGLTQSQIADKDAQQRLQKSNTLLGTDSGAFKDNRLADASTYHSPGSTDVGGYVGGAKDQQNIYLHGQANNDAAQATNAAALKTSLGNMTANRGDMSPQSLTLTNRDQTARAQAGQAIDLNRQAATGGAPSAAMGQMGMNLNNVAAGQAGALGSARGLSALNGNQSVGSAGVGMQGTQAAQAGSGAAAAEGNTNLSNYGNSAEAMVGSDQDRLNTSDRNSIANAQLNNNWQVGNAGLAAQQGGLGVSQGSMDDQWFNQSQDPMLRQLSYDQRMNAIQSGADADAADAAQAKRDASSAAGRGLLGNLASTGMTMVGTGVGTLVGAPQVGGALGSAGGGMVNSYINSK